MVAGQVVFAAQEPVAIRQHLQHAFALAALAAFQQLRHGGIAGAVFFIVIAFRTLAPLVAAVAVVLLVSVMVGLGIAAGHIALLLIALLAIIPIVPAIVSLLGISLLVPPLIALVTAPVVIGVVLALGILPAIIIGILRISRPLLIGRGSIAGLIAAFLSGLAHGRSLNRLGLRGSCLRRSRGLRRLLPGRRLRFLGGSGFPPVHDNIYQFAFAIFG